MPANLTDVNAFTTPVQVPVGGDAAGLTYLLTAFQALANRTNYLNLLRADGAWTPVVSAVTGTGADIADFTGLEGTYSRNGSTVFFSMVATIGATGWSGGITATIAPPVAGTLGTVMAAVTSNDAANFTDLYMNNVAPNNLRLNLNAAVTSAFVYVTGSYRI